MKKLNLFLVLIMLSITIFGQDIIIDFEGDGASSEVTTIEVVNLSNCTSIEVPGNEPLNLMNPPSGVDDFKNLESNNISSYPNPFGNSTSIEFYVSQCDYVTVTVCDIAGKVVANYGKELTSGVHSFEFTANNLGMYLINVSGTNFVESSKVICLSNNSQQAQLVYNEQIAGIITEKSYKNNNSKDFSFSEGDTLKIKGISGNYAYATVMVVEPTVSETFTFDFVSCQDNDGNNYAVVEIGEQTWMAENIKTTSYVGGDDILLVEDNSAWENLGDNYTDKAYCFYDNDENSIYGALYTYAAATNGNNTGTDVQGVCPTGWHMPSDDEWKELEMELGMSQEVADAEGWRGTNEGGKLKSTCIELWITPNIGATNESGFLALSGGFRFSNGSFFYVGYGGDWWSATPSGSSNAWARDLYFGNAGILRGDYYKSGGFSVRCIRND